MYHILSSTLFVFILTIVTQGCLSADKYCLELHENGGNCLEKLSENEKYVFLQEITRHGTRTAFTNLITRPWMASYGIGELTAPGFRQHWVLGNLLREKYSSVFDHRFKLAEVSSRSTGFDRTIQSANAHLEGIFSLFPTSPLLRAGPDAQGNIPMWREPGFNFYKLLQFESPLPHKYEAYPVYTPDDATFDRFLKADDEGGKVCNATFPLRAAASANFEKYINSSQLLQDTCKEAYNRYDMYDAEIEKYGFNFTNSFFIADAVLCLHENDPEDGLNMEDPADQLFY
jgi:hypothetical protein